MKKTLKNLALAGTLALSSCKFPKVETLEGKFRNYKVYVTRFSYSPFVRVFMENKIRISDPIHHDIIADDSTSDGVFERILFDGMDMKKLKPLREGLRNYPIYYQANSDSLKAAYDSVIAQNGRKKSKK